ncbi:MAG TPA: carbamoyltransferase HypF [Chitinophagaceae bacterium]
MTTYHIHINGQVQGVGFRPFVYKLAGRMGVQGWVSNSNDGVHIEFNAEPGVAAQFYHNIISSPPPNALITHHHIDEVPSSAYTSFAIRPSDTAAKPNLLFTPDIALCKECRSEVLSPGNRWSGYPFTTCLHCGPRYSIITALPYDREATTMASLPTCEQCRDEYNDVYNRRHYSQTISCNDCAIPVHLYTASGEELSTDGATISARVAGLLKNGAIVAVKGIGGYLLLCDATNGRTITTLRDRKHRPCKPFALLYPDVRRIKGDAEVHGPGIAALLDKSAPIVLCARKPAPRNRICADLIAPGLNRIGVMLPYSPLLLLISEVFGGPLIATSGNISGSPIIYKDEEALEHLSPIADYLLSYDRAIVAPQDDSLVHFTTRGQRIILRRSRGLAPTYYPNPFPYTNETVLAMGGELKAAFALLHHSNIYVSQYLGNQEHLESQQSYSETLGHMLMLLQAKPQRILVDKHPGYFVSAMGVEKAAHDNVPLMAVQHHKAHFGAVLAENGILHSNEPILGVTWDGTGYGEDGQVWGGEFFLLRDGEMQRVAHLDYFPQLLGDKMSREPRLSALSLLKGIAGGAEAIRALFAEGEWNYFNKLVQQPPALLTSSMGRFLDGVAAIMGICALNSYEGEAAMRMEALATSYRHHPPAYYPMPLVNDRLEYRVLLVELLDDLKQGKEVGLIAWKVFCSLARAISTVRDHFAIRKIAFSGGVFQNALLTELVIDQLSQQAYLYFHRQLSPNDECIGFGQIACYQLIKKDLAAASSKKRTAASERTI